MSASASDWRTITPLHLHKPVEHIRKGFETGTWRCSQITGKLCFFALHQGTRESESLAEWFEVFEQYRQVIGAAAIRDFNRTLSLRTPPAVFRAYFDAFYEGMRILVREQFEQMLTIGLANSEVLDSEPVNWAKTHVHLLIERRVTWVERWIKEVCDVQETPKPDFSEADFEEQVFWRNWRAPLLIYMQPAGNKPYDPATAWTREDEHGTRRVLQVRCRRFIEFLEIELEDLAGGAYVRVSQDKEHSQLLKHRSSEPHSASPGSQPHEDKGIGATFHNARGIAEPAKREDPDSLQSTSSDQGGLKAVTRMVRNPQGQTTLLVAQAAQYLGVRPRTIYRWVKDGKLRSGARRGSVTIESIQLYEKKRARKPRSRADT